MKHSTILLLALVIQLSFVSCEKEIPEPPVTEQKGTRINPTPPANHDTGTLMIYALNKDGCANEFESIKVYVDGNYKGKLDKVFLTSTPTCWTAGTLSLSLKAGEYSVYAQCSTAYWPEFKVIISNGKCIIRGLK